MCILLCYAYEDAWVRLISSSGKRWIILHDRGIFQLREKLDQCFAQGWHHIGRVVERQTSNESHSDHAVVEMLIVQCDEQRPDVLGLG